MVVPLPTRPPARPLNSFSSLLNSFSSFRSRIVSVETFPFRCDLVLDTLAILVLSATSTTCIDAPGDLVKGLA